MTVRTRMAPSPTGELHIGSLRTALYDYALARQNNGQFILRIEDTDQKRFVPGSIERIIETLKNYGLSIDGEPYYQTKRLDIYKKYADELLAQKLAYYCFCTEDRLKEMRDLQKAAKKLPKYDRHCLNLTEEEIKQKLANNEPRVIRMKIPQNETITFTDIVRGKVSFNTNDVDDQVIIKSNGIPTYHFAVVVDDHLMEITHVFRGEEWLPSVPKHLLLFRYFGWEPPLFAHLSLFLDPSHSGKMSKRYGSVSAKGFLDEGYLPEAILNFIMLLGWNPGTEQEIFSLDQFVKAFSLEKLNKKAAIFDRKKLDYFNGLYIRQKTNADLFPYFKKFLPQASDDQITALIPVLKDRLVKFGDLPIQTKFLFEDVEYDKFLLSQYKDHPMQKELVVDMLTATKKIFQNINQFNALNIKTEIDKLLKSEYWQSEDNLTGRYYMVLRVAVCGSTFTPPIVECLPILGKENFIRKLDIALAKLAN